MIGPVIFGSLAAAALAACLYQSLYLAFSDSMLHGKRVLICGASMGIGEQIVYEHAIRGANMVIVSRSQDKLEAVAAKARSLALARSFEISVDVFTADLADEAIPESLVSHTVTTLGGLDIVILNHILTTGHASWGTWSGPNGTAAKDGGKFGPDLLKRMFALNVFSYVNIATAALPFLEKSRGSIVVVSSAVGKMGFPKVAPYSASKHALHGFFDSLRHELVIRRKEVAVTLCVIGNIDTKSNADGTGGDLNPHLARYPADECALTITKAAALRRREMFYPQLELVPLTLLRPFMPSTLDVIARNMMLSEQGWKAI